MPLYKKYKTKYDLDGNKIWHVDKNADSSVNFTDITKEDIDLPAINE